MHNYREVQEVERNRAAVNRLMVEAARKAKNPTEAHRVAQRTVATLYTAHPEIAHLLIEPDTLDHAPIPFEAADAETRPLAAQAVDKGREDRGVELQLDVAGQVTAGDAMIESASVTAAEEPVPALAAADATTPDNSCSVATIGTYLSRLPPAHDDSCNTESYQPEAIPRAAASRPELPRLRWSDAHYRVVQVAPTGDATGTPVAAYVLEHKEGQDSLNVSRWYQCMSIEDQLTALAYFIRLLGDHTCILPRPTDGVVNREG
jgi:hypothetical protein